MENKRELGQNVLLGKARTTVEQVDITDFEPTFIGKFKFHSPTVMERMRIGVAKSQLLQGLEGHVDVMTDNIAHMSATLAVVIDDAPTWFNLDEIYEYEVLERVYDKYFEWNSSFRKASDQSNDAENSGGSGQQV